MGWGQHGVGPAWDGGGVNMGYPTALGTMYSLNTYSVPCILHLSAVPVLVQFFCRQTHTGIA